jgi:membrane protease YdiL (CAAX protease family)
MEARKGSFGYPEAFGWSFLALGALLLAAQGLVLLRPEIGHDLVSLGILSAAIYLLFAAVLLGLHGPRDKRRPEDVALGRGDNQLAAALGLRSTAPALPFLGLFLGAAAQLPADGVRRVVERFSPLTEQEALQRAAQLTSSSPLHSVMLVLVAACLVPLAEEIFFRGALFGALTRSGRRVGGAALVTSLAFTASHADPRLWAPIGVVALIAGYLRVVSGSLLPCVALHVGFNSVTILGTVTGLIHPYGDVEVPPVGMALGWLLVAALLVTVGWLARGSERARQSRREDANER